MIELMFPVGRMIGGSMYKPNPRTGNDGKPILNATTGQPETSYSFGVAIPKQGEANWAMTPWGAQIRSIGDTAYPGQSQAPTFAWKITDGDSQIPNKKNRRPCDQEGYPGHWVLWFSQSWAPKLCNATGAVELTEQDAIVPGYYIQVYGGVAANKPKPGASHTPGIYLNPIAVALAAYGNRIETSSVDTTTVGFGQGVQLPPGASAQPVAAMRQPDALPNPPSGMTTPPPPPTPNAAFLKTMTPLAGGVPYDQWIAQGWTDDVLRANGYLL